MTNMITATREIAKLRAAQTGHQSGPIGPIFDRLRSLFHKLWPAKTALNYSWQTGTCEKTGRRVVEGERDPSGEALIVLLRGANGGEIYRAIMEGCTQQHWKDYRRGVAVGTSLREAQEAKRKFEAAIAGIANQA